MEETLHHLLMTDYLLFHKSLIAEIKNTQLSSGQPKVLDYLTDHDGALQKDIAAACCIEPATLTSVLLGMENKQLIKRKTLNGNRRNLYVYLTEKGKIFAERIKDEFEKIEEKALSGFDEEEKRTLNSYLSRIAQNIKTKGVKFNE